MKFTTLLLLVLLLWLHLFLRAHNITRLPIFVDEDNHIRRASILYDFDQHPAQNSHGKFLLYFVLGIFDLKQRDTALHLARTMVALTSLLNAALIFAIGRKLFNQNAAFFGVAFYALIPFAFFYERMALADSLAGTTGLFTLWMSIRYAERPTWNRAGLVGIFAALTVAAKLTMAFAVGFPLFAALFLGNYDSLRHAWKRYMPGLIFSGAVFILCWLPILIPARISLTTDAPDFIIVNTELAQSDADTSSLLEKIQETGEKTLKMGGFIIAFMVTFLIMLQAMKPSARINFLLICLLLAWLPSILFVQNLQTRYLMSGIPMVALLFAAVNQPIFEGKTDSPFLPGWVAFVLLYLILGLPFAFPFAATAMSKPYDLNVPELDARNYFWDRYNGYGTIDALNYLADQEESASVVMLITTCRIYDLYADDHIQQICSDTFDNQSYGFPDWQTPARERLESGESVYAITDYLSERDPAFSWEQIAVFEKPFGKQEIILWRLGE